MMEIVKKELKIQNKKKIMNIKIKDGSDKYKNLKIYKN